MLAFPNAKINLGLSVIHRRPDGYHEIISCLYPIPWRDVLEIVPTSTFSFTQTGLNIPGDQHDNLCVKAYQLLKADHQLPPVSIHLHKVIPMGAGLGGGSADGSFTIKLLNVLFDLKLSVDKMQSYVSLLGSDCPFFIENKPALATGTGTTLSLFDVSLKGYYLGLLYPNAHVSTKDAYGGIVPHTPNQDISDVLKSPIDTWQGNLVNDFEKTVFDKFPVIAATKAKMLEWGAVYAAMSGSGACVFGLFKKDMESELKRTGLPYFHALLS